MFGGLEVKGASSKEENDKPEAPVQSAFAFLSGATSDPPPPPPAAAAPSGFSFMSSASAPVAADAVPAAVSNEAPAAAAATTTSAFSFLAPTTETTPPSPPAAAPASSAFSFLQAPPSTDPPLDHEDDADSELAAAAAEPSTSFSFLSVQNNPSAPSTPLEPEEASPEPPMTSIPPDASPPPPVVVGSGLVFGGAAVQKKKIKKRARGVRVGQGRTEALPPPAAPRPISPVAATLERQAQQGNETNTEGTTTKEEALDAMRRAEALMEKMQEQHPPTSNDAALRAPSSSYSTQPMTTTPAPAPVVVDETYEAARQAAEEAQAQLAKQKRPFGLPWLRKDKHGSRESSMGGGPIGSSSHHSTGSSHSQVETAAERIQREQEDIKRAMAERSLAMQQQQQAPPLSEGNGGVSPEVPASSSSEYTAPATSSWGRNGSSSGGWGGLRSQTPSPPPPPKTPQECLAELLQSFEVNVQNAMDRVAQLRQQRNMLLEERFVSFAKERLAVQQIAQAEAQQTAAAEAEDFDLADQLATVIDAHLRDKAELEAILDNIGRALAQLESQKKEVVGGVGACFEAVKDQLEAFQEEQASAEKTDDTESMRRFSATAKQLSAENERLQNDFKILERDEELMKEERNELELAIHEQTEDMESHRDKARENLQQVEDEIEELRKQLREKEARASTLRSEMESYVSGISKVRVKFSRQLTRVEKKEVSLRENRSEWENEKNTYESLKMSHEAEVKEHSEALLAHEELMSTLKREITLAATFQGIVDNEIVFESTGDQGIESDGDLAQLQADVVKCEAAMSEGKQMVKAAEAVLSSLDSEHKVLQEKIPALEEEKKAAVARRDFKSAGRVSKEIKDAKTRLQECQDELTGDAAERKEAALKDLEGLEKELETKQAIAHEKEKEAGIEAMEKLAEKLRRLIATKGEICGEAAPGTIQGVGALVLKAQLDALRREGEIYGAKFGGWETLVQDIDEVLDEKDSGVGYGVEPAESRNPSTTLDDDDAGQKEEVTNVKKERPADEIDPERIAKFREVWDQLKIAEEALEDAVAKEDYDEAAEVDEQLEQIKTELELLSLTDAEQQVIDSEQELTTEEGECEVPEDPVAEEEQPQEVEEIEETPDDNQVDEAANDGEEAEGTKEVPTNDKGENGETATPEEGPRCGDDEDDEPETLPVDPEVGEEEKEASETAAAGDAKDEVDEDEIIETPAECADEEEDNGENSPVANEGSEDDDI